MSEDNKRSFNRFVVVGNETEGLRDQVLDTLSSSRTTYLYVGSIEEVSLREDDLLVVVGDDREILKALRGLSSHGAGILTVGVESTRGFLTSASIEDFKEVVSSLLRGNYRVDKVPIISFELSEGGGGIAINEVVISPIRPATLMEYTLSIDGEVIWRDKADGVIVSTPIGSSAYALSAGGSLIHYSTRAFEVVPINSIDLTRRPLVVSADSEIVIEGVRAPCEVQIVADGIERIGLKGHVRLARFLHDLKLVRPTWVQPISKKIEKKIHLAETLLPLPPSAKLILRMLEYEGPMNYEKLLERTALPERTLRYGLNRLVESGLVKKYNDPSDARRKLYALADSLKTSPA